MVDKVTSLAWSLYTAYGNHADWTTWNGNQMPNWVDLSDTVQSHWIAAAKCAMCIVVENVSGYVQELNWIDEVD